MDWIICAIHYRRQSMHLARGNDLSQRCVMWCCCCCRCLLLETLCYPAPDRCLFCLCRFSMVSLVVSAVALIFSSHYYCCDHFSLYSWPVKMVWLSLVAFHSLSSHWSTFQTHQNLNSELSSLSHAFGTFPLHSNVHRLAIKNCTTETVVDEWMKSEMKGKHKKYISQIMNNAVVKRRCDRWSRNQLKKCECVFFLSYFSGHIKRNFGVMMNSYR